MTPSPAFETSPPCSVRGLTVWTSCRRPICFAGSGLPSSQIRGFVSFTNPPANVEASTARKTVLERDEMERLEPDGPECGDVAITGTRRSGSSDTPVVVKTRPLPDVLVHSVPGHRHFLFLCAGGRSGHPMRSTHRQACCLRSVGRAAPIAPMFPRGDGVVGLAG
jgi:hypothetical protein